MNRPDNRRSRETKEKLKEAFLALLSEGRSPQTVTVKELCEKSGINRSTFYAHYSIPEDILRETENAVLRETKNYITAMAGNETENVISFLSFIKQNRETFRILLQKNSQTGFTGKLVSQVIPIFNEIEQKPYRKYLFSYVKSYAIDGAAAVVTVWLDNGCRESEEQIAALIIELSRKVIDTSFSMKSGSALP